MTNIPTPVRIASEVDSYLLFYLKIMEKILPIIQIVISVLLVIVVLLQERGTGAGAIFGGGSQVFRAKRGPEKTLHYITIFLGIAFFATAFYQTFLTK